MVHRTPFFQKRSATTPLSQLGINMVDLMMWLVIAALLLAAALQGIAFYQQAAHVYQAKSDTSASNTWVAARVAQDGVIPALPTLSSAVANGDLKLTQVGVKQNGVLMSVSGNSYCVGVSSPMVNGNNVFYVSSTAPGDIIRAATMPTTCGTAISPSAITAPATGGSLASGPLPAVRSSQLKFGIASNTGTDTDATARLVNESPSLISFYEDWTQSVDLTTLNGISSKGATPVITWEPWDHVIAGTDQPTYKLSNIAAGTQDTYIKSWATDLKSYNKPVMIRFAHEMNGNWYPWAEQVNGNAPGDYVKAWKHVVDVFRAQGVTNVEWVWAPNVPYTGSTDIAGLYPGSTYVNSTAMDGFNFGTTKAYSTWTKPWDLFGSGLGALQYVAPDKNIIITETASSETEGTNTKSQWIADVVYYLNHWGDGKGGIRVSGMIWFDINKEADWRISSSAASADAMKTALAAR